MLASEISSPTTSAWGASAARRKVVAPHPQPRSRIRNRRCGSNRGKISSRSRSSNQQSFAAFCEKEMFQVWASARLGGGTVVFLAFARGLADEIQRPSDRFAVNPREIFAQHAHK